MLSADQQGAVAATRLPIEFLAAAEPDMLKALYPESGLSAKDKILVHSAIKIFKASNSQEEFASLEQVINRKPDSTEDKNGDNICVLKEEQSQAVAAGGVKLEYLAEAEAEMLKEFYQESGLTARQKILVHAAIKIFKFLQLKETQSELTASPVAAFRAAPSPCPSSDFSLGATQIAAFDGATSNSSLSMRRTAAEIPKKTFALPDAPPSSPPVAESSPETPQISKDENTAELPFAVTRSEVAQLVQEKQTPLDFQEKVEDKNSAQENNWREAHGVLPSLVEIAEPGSVTRRSNRKLTKPNGGATQPRAQTKRRHSPEQSQMQSPTSLDVVDAISQLDFVCDICKIKSETARAADAHSLTKTHLVNIAVVNAMVTENGKPLWQCHLCQYQSDAGSLLRKHLHACHKEMFGGDSHKRKLAPAARCVTRRTYKGSTTTNIGNQRRSSREWTPSLLSLQSIANVEPVQSSKSEPSPLKNPSPRVDQTARPRVVDQTSKARSTQKPQRRGKEPVHRASSRTSVRVQPQADNDPVPDLIQGLENYIQTQNGSKQGIKSEPADA